MMSGSVSPPASTKSRVKMRDTRVTRPSFTCDHDVTMLRAAARLQGSTFCDHPTLTSLQVLFFSIGHTALNFEQWFLRGRWVMHSLVYMFAHVSVALQ